MRARVGILAVVLALGAAGLVFGGTEDETVQVQASDSCRHADGLNCNGDFGFRPLDEIPDLDVVRISLSNGEWGPWVAFSLERTPDGDVTLTTSVLTEPVMRSGQAGDPAPVVRTRRVAPQAAARFYKAVADHRDGPPYRRNRQDLYMLAHLEARAGGRLIGRAGRRFDGGLVRLADELAALAARLQPECAPLARAYGWRGQAHILARCHAISGDVSAGAEADAASERFFAGHFERGGLAADRWLAPDVEIEWDGEATARGPEEAARLLKALFSSTWTMTPAETRGTSSLTATVHGYIATGDPATGREAYSHSTQAWTKDRRGQWRLKSWTVSPAELSVD